MARRKQHKSKQQSRKARRSKARSTAAAPANVRDSNRPLPTGPPANISKPMARRRTNPTTLPLTPTIVGMPSLPLSLAVYRPASLFAMLLIAALLPKNTFSLRWLALSSGYNSGQCQWGRGMGMKPLLRDCLYGKFELMGHDFEKCESIAVPKEWEELGIITVLSTKQKRSEQTISSLDDSIYSEVLSIARGGHSDNIKPPYSGLINLGNTCYLNAQLQCAYHVPLLRELVLNARDEVVEVEVEDEKIDEAAGSSDDVKDLETEPAAESEENSETISVSDRIERAEKQMTKKTVIKTEHRPISQALRALQQTFYSLAGQSSGSTQTLCRSLGINPYIQQDGQEFWKLFVPEVDYANLTELYTGYYDDYIREVVPRNAESECWEEKKDDDELFVEREEVKPRERVRTDPFLDLSIPVTDGAGCSVEASLRETFIQPEILRVSEGNGWRPSKNAEKVDAYKGLSLKRDGLPSLLQLHLKRFKYDWETGETSKINDCCTFPLELDLSEIIYDVDEEDKQTSDAIYDLQSVVVHRGEYGSGHYYSYVRPDIKTNEWYRFDDQIVTPVDFNDVIADAYGGKARRKRSNSFDDRSAGQKRRRGLLRRIFSFGGFGGERNGGDFGYGGRTSSAYMIQYVRRSDINKLGY